TLIRNARIFTGNGRLIENGAVLVKNGKIAEIYEGSGPDPKSLSAAVIEAAGKTILPGLIDMHVHLGAPGGLIDDFGGFDPQKAAERELAAYLYCGVTAVRSVGDLLDSALATRRLVNSGEKLGAEFFTFGPLFTAPGGHGTEFFRGLPPAMRDRRDAQFLRLPKTPEEAAHQVDALKQAGVDGIKAVLESGAAALRFNRLDPKLIDAIGTAARRDDLPV